MAFATANSLGDGRSRSVRLPLLHNEHQWARGGGKMNSEMSKLVGYFVIWFVMCHYNIKSFIDWKLMVKNATIRKSAHSIGKYNIVKMEYSIFTHYAVYLRLARPRRTSATPEWRGPLSLSQRDDLLIPLWLLVVVVVLGTIRRGRSSCSSPSVRPSFTHASVKLNSWHYSDRSFVVINILLLAMLMVAADILTHSRNDLNGRCLPIRHR